MLVSRKSPFTGKNNVMDLDITEEQVRALSSPGRPEIQKIAPNLSAEEREFLLTGYTDEDWKSMFSYPDDM